MKIFELDVTNCELPQHWGDLPKIIRLTTGRYQLDFDVVEDAVSAAARQIPQVQGNPAMPAGFNVERMPVGAVLRRLPDSDEA